jgi:hypothetical protein
MYYPSYEDYMRDVFYFNGLTNPNAMYYPQATNSQNLNNMYPSIYKIVNPVIQKVVASSNQFANEDTVNNIVNVVMGITAGDVNNLENVGNNNDINKNPNGNYQNSNGGSNSKTQNIAENSLLKDLIKILTIKELLTRNNVRRFPYTYGDFYMNNQMMPYMVN